LANQTAFPSRFSLWMSLLEQILGCGWCNHSQQTLQDTHHLSGLLRFSHFPLKLLQDTHVPLVALCPRSGSSLRRHLFCPRLPLFVCYSHNKWLSSHNHVASSVTAIVSYDTAISQCRKWLPAQSKTHGHLGGSCSSSLCASFLYTFRLEWTFSPSRLFPREFQGLYQNAFEILGIDERLTSTYVHEWLNQLPTSTSCSTTLSFALESPSWLSQLLFRTCVTMPVKRLLSVHATQSSLLF
jgi:hypothetical protein